MSAAGPTGAAGLTMMLRVQWRIHRHAVSVWVILLVASMAGTAISIGGLYDTQAKVHSYAAAVTAGSALLAINGKVEGIDSLGGVIQDEFGFLAAFLVPLMGISLIARSTRREEEAGRLEAVLAGRVARHVPALAALLVAWVAIAVTAIGFAGGLMAGGVPVAGAALYSLSLGALAVVFTGLAALLAQLTLHARGVYTGSLIVLAVAYLLRGVGDVTRTWITWLSPLGWAERAAPFGPARWWTLLLPLVAGGLLSTAAVRIAARRDLGSGLMRGGAGPAHASPRLRTAVGLAVWIHRPTVIGWLSGAALLAVMMGSLAQQLLDAMAGNSALAAALGASGERPEDGFIAATQLYLAVIAAGYVVQAVGVMRGEETAGRLEPRLAGTLSRRSWLAAHAAVVVAGLLTVVLGGSLALGASAASSLGDGAELRRIIGAGLAYLPAELTVGGLALALFGLRPRAFPLAWAGYAVTAFIALLGPGLKLPGWVRDTAPTTHVGNPPQGAVEPAALAILAVLAVAFVAVSFAGFRRRRIPQG